MAITADLFGLTDPGKVRESNEDQFLLAELSKSLLILQTSLAQDDHTRLFGGPPGKVLLVADGMGGVRGGRRASRVVVETVIRYVLDTMHWFFRLQQGEESDLVDELKAGLAACQKAVEAAATAHPEHERMGTTLTLAYLLWPRAYVIHAGDSRAYLYRDGQLQQVTRDQTVAQRMVDQGLLAADKAEDTRWAHVLSSCISARPETLNVDIFRVSLQAGDTLLLCTDGLAKPITDADIAGHLANVPKDGAKAVAERLVAAANDAGGPDNITIVLGHFRAAE
jgi:serine/threonine protein phosphatase PrpC